MDSHQLINQNSGNVEWYTPKKIVRVATRLMGVITLDPACSAHAFEYQGEHAESYYYEKGLSLMWWGNVWLNPPFGLEIKDWIARLVKLYKEGEVKQACCITFNSTETDWGQMLLPYPQYFFKRSVKYIDSDKLRGIIRLDKNGKPKKKSSATNGSVFTWLTPQGIDYDLALIKLHNEMSWAGFQGTAK